MSYINSDQLWRQGDQDDSAAQQAFKNLLYVWTTLSFRLLYSFFKFMMLKNQF